MSEDDDVLYVTNLKKYFYLGGSRLDRIFGGEKTKRFVHAVDGVWLRIRKKETLGLVGESGSGKSTLGRCVLGLIPPTSGTILFEGIDVNKASRREKKTIRKKMQIVFQDPVDSLDPLMRVRDIILEPLKVVDGLSKGKEDEALERMMSVVGLGAELANRFPHEFSGGQRQRIGIARALITSPEFLVLDEPTSALDASIQAQILNLLKDLKKEFALTSLFISHNMKVVHFMSERIAVMYLGRIVEITSKEEIMSEPLHPYTKMLIASIPKGDPDERFTETDEGRKVIEQGGEIPSAVNPPSGCVFHPRCPYVMDKCKQREPKLMRMSQTRSVACFLYGDSIDS